MTINDAILKSLEDLKKIVNYQEVTDHIIAKSYYDFQNAKTPSATISAALGSFIRKGDQRVKRVERSSCYFYYLAEFEGDMGVDSFMLDSTVSQVSSKKYHERDLHILLSSYLKMNDIYSKTILHEESNGSDNNQIWTHPDVVGVNFLELKKTASKRLLKCFNQTELFSISSYELKKGINSDTELKKAYFQAVSNSSWANFGYLVFLEYNRDLLDEMFRLNQSFGIGFIHLSPRRSETQILFASKYKNLDIKTIDKLCGINKTFSDFIEQIEKQLTVGDRYVDAVKNELLLFSDSFLEDDSDIINYCTEKNIPIK